MKPIYTLTNASLRREGLELRELDWEIPARGVSLLLGPAGTGKSTLLRALGGRLDPGECDLGGYWVFEGRDVTRRLRRGEALEGVFHSPQPPRRAESRDNAWAEAALEDARHSLVLLDEPNRRVDPTKLAELEGAIEHRARSAAIVIVTHDLAFARRIGDHVCLIAAGRPLALQSAEDFFESPASESAAHFIREGNCWPERYAPTLPNHFCWVLEGQLGGMAYPGMLSDENEELEAIAQAGIEVLVSTTVDAFPREKLRPFGIEGRHLPIKDMDVPAVRTTASICAGMKRAIDAGRGVAVHCRAGLGRTGLLVASYLVWDGRSAAEAIEAVRRVNARYIQTTSQEKFIRQFAETIGR